MAEKIIEFSVSDDVSAVRADKLFAAEFEEVSRMRLQRAFDAGQVTFDGEVIQKRFKVNRAGLLRAVLDEPDATSGPRAVDLPLEIIYEDESILVVNKMPGMVTHPGSGTGDDTLVHGLLHYCGEHLSSVGAPDRPGIVHRLDKETSGLIAVAKTDAAHHRMVAAFSERKTYKRYTALVLGKPRIRSGSCRDPIGRHRVVRTRMSIHPNGREAHTDWSLKESFQGRVARMECIIHTGRTHQIRVHMSHLGYPLLGDTTYGFKPNRLKGIDVPRVMLHSTELRIAHPEKGEIMRFEAPLPVDFLSLMEKLRSD